MGKYFEELAYQCTQLGELTLSRRRIPSLGTTDIYEIKLNDEYLMSSLFFGSEVALATLGLESCQSQELDVIVGGLGLGFTAAAALDDARVKSLFVVEFLEPVISWHKNEMIPLGKRLSSDSRYRFRLGDFFRLAAGEPEGFDPEAQDRLFHAILLDIDHSPKHFLNSSHSTFYEEAGLRAMCKQLHEGGVFALWSNDPPEKSFIDKLKAVFPVCTAHVVSFPNPIQQGESRCTVYVAVKA